MEMTETQMDERKKKGKKLLSSKAGRKPDSRDSGKLKQQGGDRKKMGLRKDYKTEKGTQKQFVKSKTGPKYGGPKGSKGGMKYQKPGPKKQDGQKNWKRGQKRKHSEDTDGDAKRPRMEEMKKKERKQVRRQVKNNFELAQQAKTIWAIVRKHNCKAETRHKHISELCELLKGRIAELVLAHDTVRVIQCCVQFGNDEQRAEIFEEVKDKIVEFSKSKYAKFYILKMLRYGSKEQRLAIMRAFHGKVCQLVRHKEAAEVLEEAYNNHANAVERSALMEEFYGARFAIFKESGVHSLADILAKEPASKQIIMEHMLKTLTPLVDKSVVKHTIVHKALHDFLQHAPDPKRNELIEAMRDIVVQILHTQDGARAAMHCLWYGTAKDRKVIIKSFKTFVVKICKEEFGHRVLLALFDCVDDTKIVSKVIIEEMMKSAYEIATDQYGRKVLFYLLVPRDPSHFHPDIVKQLQKGDSNPTSKKDMATRRRELLEASSPAFLKLLLTHTKEMAYSNSNSQLALAILEHALGDKKDSYSMLATLAAEDLIPMLVSDPSKMEEMHIVEHPSGHLLLRRLLAHEKTQREKGDVSSSFSNCLLSELTDENIRSWVKVNRGAFVLASLADCGNEEARKRITEAVTTVRKSMAKMTSKGVQILLEKLDK